MAAGLSASSYKQAILMHWGVFYYVIKLKRGKGMESTYIQLTAWKRREGKNYIK
jgi:hypothetical protein